MVALTIVLMFAVFIAADYMFNREKYRLPVAASSAAVHVPETVASLGFHLHFHPAHTWAAPESDQVARIGLDVFAASILPPLSKVDTPKLARWVSQGGRGFTLHCGDKEVTLLSPVDGEVVEINHEVLSDPTLLKSDPYGKGWLLKLRAPDMAVSIRNLFGPELMQAWTDDSMARLRQFFAPPGLTPALASNMVTAQDGGTIVDSLTAKLDEEQWKKMTAEFFRS
jgi:glycine cleavage system H protein